MRVLAVFWALLAPVQALALSCLQPSVENSFRRYHDAPAAYVIVQGTLHFDEALLPKPDHRAGSTESITEISGQLTGHVLSRRGFKTPFEQVITLNVHCFGPWCGGTGRDEDVLAFVKRDAGQYAIDVHPCPGAIFSQPTNRQLRRVTSCFQGKYCPKN